jgi:transcription elongation factor/antiterminator RfaH
VELVSQTLHGSAGRWFVVHTQPHLERRAICNLERQEFLLFCPSLRKTIRHARKMKRTLVPLFPGYIFVRLDPAKDLWRKINGTRGVVRLITSGERPTPVPCGVVEALQDRVGADGVLDWAPILKVGQRVQVMDGPFTEFVGTLERLDASGRVRVLLNLLGRSVVVALRRETLMPDVQR